MWTSGRANWKGGDSFGALEQQHPSRVVFVTSRSTAAKLSKTYKPFVSISMLKDQCTPYSIRTCAGKKREPSGCRPPDWDPKAIPGLQSSLIPKARTGQAGGQLSGPLLSRTHKTVRRERGGRSMVAWREKGTVTGKSSSLVEGWLAS